MSDLSVFLIAGFLGTCELHRQLEAGRCPLLPWHAGRDPEYQLRTVLSLVPQLKDNFFVGV